MKSKIAQRIIDETLDDVKIFVRKYGDIVVRIHQILRERGLNQRELADRLEKTPSEVSKWLSGNHNFTLRSLSKLEAELGAEILYVPKPDSFHVQWGGQFKAAVQKPEPISGKVKFSELKRKSVQPSDTPIAA